MGWRASLSAVRKVGEYLVPIAPAMVKYDLKWEIWSSGESHIKNLISESAIAPFTGEWPYFERLGHCTGIFLPFLTEDAALSLKRSLPAEIKEHLNSLAGDEDDAFFFPASLKDWLDFDYEQIIGKLDLEADGKVEEITFREFINRYSAGSFFEALTYLKQQGEPEDIYILASWS